MLVSAPGRPLGQVLREQLKANPANAPILHQVLGATADLEARKCLDSSRLNPALLRLFGPNVQGFLISAFSYDPAKLLLPGVNHMLKAVSASSGGWASLAYMGSSEVWSKDPTPPISDLSLFALPRPTSRSERKGK